MVWCALACLLYGCLVMPRLETCQMRTFFCVIQAQKLTTMKIDKSKTVAFFGYSRSEIDTAKEQGEQSSFEIKEQSSKAI